MNKRIFKSVAGIIVLVAVIGVMCIKSQSISMERDLKTNLEIMGKAKRKNNEKVIIGYKETIDLNLNKFFIVTIKKLLKKRRHIVLGGYYMPSFVCLNFLLNRINIVTPSNIH